MNTLDSILKRTISYIKLKIEKELDFSKQNFLKDYIRNYCKYSANYRPHKY